MRKKKIHDLTERVGKWISMRYTFFGLFIYLIDVTKTVNIFYIIDQS
jgi:hypothetical protein